VDVETAIHSRRTHKQFGREPVDEAVVRDLLDLARFAPNHKVTQPWRFRLLGPDTRTRLNEAVGEKEAMKLGRAPTLVLATAVLSGDPSTDEEDLHATACAVYAVLLGATSRGLASYWRTPAALGAVAVREPPAKERLPLDDVFSVLP
jgi:nitroreductase